MPHTFSVLCSPLIAANECLGVIHCSNKKTALKLFVEKAKKLISSVAKDEKLICNKKIKNLSKNSIITNIEKVKKSTKSKLKNILK